MSTVDYFELLRLPEHFLIDASVLETAYFARQRQYHPDQFVNKEPEERARAMQRSVDVNKAYETLKNPLKRAQYLLQRRGVQVGGDADSVKPSQEILVEAMELRESPPSAERLRAMTEKSINAIADYYEQQNFEAMAQETLRLGYLMKARGKA
jgi:molecular chaperone HscB